MTIDYQRAKPKLKEEVLLPEGLLAARDRVARRHARERRSLAWGRARRRFLPAVVIGSALLFTVGVADRFVQALLPPTRTASAPALGSAPASVNNQTLAQVAQTLAADQKAIAALARAQAQLARSAGGDAGSALGASNLAIPKLPSLPALPSFSAPALPSAPAAHATTGASVVVP